LSWTVPIDQIRKLGVCSCSSPISRLNIDGEV
jgi:hypothetical protein